MDWSKVVGDPDTTDSTISTIKWREQREANECDRRLEEEAMKEEKRQLKNKFLDPCYRFRKDLTKLQKLEALLDQYNNSISSTLKF